MISLSKRLLTLAAISTLSFGFIACDDDAGGSSTNNTNNNTDETCSGDVRECDGNTYKYCDNNKLKTVDCKGLGDTYSCDVNKNGCYNTDEKCTAADNGCGEDGKLYICNTGTGKLEPTDCSTDNKICDSESLSCVFECENTEAPSCANAGTRRFCENNHYKTESCPDSAKACLAGECVNKSIKAICADQGMDVNEAGTDCKVIDSIIGTPCKCTGGEEKCTIVITGKEFKDIINTNLTAFGSAIGMDINSMIDQIADDDKIIAPNYFPGKENIEGCDNLVVPEGMTLGCFTDSKIQFPDSITGLIKELPNNAKIAEMMPAGSSEKITGIAGILEDGIEFKAQNGYCIAATIDIGDSAAIKALGFIDVLKQDPLNKNNGLVKKINTGDHSKVVSGKVAADKAEKNYCPDGSALFSYSLKENIDKSMSMVSVKLKVNIGFDMCLKACKTNDDCRKDEGYSCVELPDGVPAEGQTSADLPTKKACFSQATIDYFTQMTNEFAPAE